VLTSIRRGQADLQEDAQACPPSRAYARAEFGAIHRRVTEDRCDGRKLSPRRRDQYGVGVQAR
jgi:hypothetical protein